MKLKDLKPIIRSLICYIQPAIIRSTDNGSDLTKRGSIEAAINAYGEYEVDRITAIDDCLIIYVK